MVPRIFFHLFFCFLFKCSFSQTYFNFFYTNIPKPKYDAYSVVNSKGFGWLQTGNYKSPSSCKNCFDLSRDSKLVPSLMDSLINLYDKSILDTLYAKQYVPSHHHFGIEKNKSSPFIIHTLYRVNYNKVEPLVQIKMTFYERKNSLPGILSIEFLQSGKLRQFDSRLVLEAYQKQLKDDKEEVAPSIKSL